MKKALSGDLQSAPACIISNSGRPSKMAPDGSLLSDAPFATRRTPLPMGIDIDGMLVIT